VQASLRKDMAMQDIMAIPGRSPAGPRAREPVAATSRLPTGSSG
jgi:hypothetical protein